MKWRFQSTDPNNTRIEDSAKKCAETAKYGGANDLLQNATKNQTRRYYKTLHFKQPKMKAKVPKFRSNQNRFWKLLWFSWRDCWEKWCRIGTEWWVNDTRIRAPRESMGILRISFHRGTKKSYIRFFPNLEFLYKTAGDPGGREEQGSLRRD